MHFLQLEAGSEVIIGSFSFTLSFLFYSIFTELVILVAVS